MREIEEGGRKNEVYWEKSFLFIFERGNLSVFWRLKLASPHKELGGRMQYLPSAIEPPLIAEEAKRNWVVSGDSGNITIYIHVCIYVLTYF